MTSSPRLELRPLGLMVERTHLEHGAWLDLRPGWLSNSDALFERLAVDVPWKADQREMYEKVVDVPRLVSWFGAGAALPDPVLTQAMADLNDHYGRLPARCSRPRDSASTAPATTASPGTATGSAARSTRTRWWRSSRWASSARSRCGPSGGGAGDAVRRSATATSS